MPPEELLKRLLGSSRVPFLGEQLEGVMLNTIRAAYAVAYMDASNTCREWASEHTTDEYGKAELESMARLLKLRAEGKEVR